MTQTEFILFIGLDALRAGQKICRAFDTQRKQQIWYRLETESFAQFTANRFARIEKRHFAILFAGVQQHRKCMQRHCAVVVVYYCTRTSYSLFGLLVLLLICVYFNLLILTFIRPKYLNGTDQRVVYHLDDAVPLKFARALDVDIVLICEIQSIPL